MSDGHEEASTTNDATVEAVANKLMTSSAILQYEGKVGEPEIGARCTYCRSQGS